MWKKNIIYTVTTLVILFTSIYFFLPFNLIKEITVGQLQSLLDQQNTGLHVEIKSLSGYWFTGISAKEIRVVGLEGNAKPLIIDNIHARVSVLPLLIGRIRADVGMKIGKGTGSFSASASIFDLISNKIQLLSAAGEFNNFQVDDIFTQVFYVLKANSSPAMALLGPLIADSSIGGKLNGTIEYTSNQKEPSNIDLVVNNAFLDINNKTLNIKKQNFTEAKLKLTYEDSLLTVNKETKFTAENISLAAQGNVKLENQKKANLNLTVGFKLSGEIEKNFAFLIPQFLKCNSNSMVEGVLNAHLAGPVDNFTCSP